MRCSLHFAWSFTPPPPSSRNEAERQTSSRHVVVAGRARPVRSLCKFLPSVNLPSERVGEGGDIHRTPTARNGQRRFAMLIACRCRRREIRAFPRIEFRWLLAAENRSLLPPPPFRVPSFNRFPISVGDFRPPVSERKPLKSQPKLSGTPVFRGGAGSGKRMFIRVSAI